MIDFHMIDDAMGHPTDTLMVSDCRHAIVLVANQPRSVMVPAKARRVLINATAPVWVQYGGGGVIPTADDLSGNAPELNPVARSLTGIPSLGLVAASACIVSLCFYT